MVLPYHQPWKPLTGRRGCSGSTERQRLPVRGFAMSSVLLAGRDGFPLGGFDNRPATPQPRHPVAIPNAGLDRAGTRASATRTANGRESLAVPNVNERRSGKDSLHPSLKNEEPRRLVDATWNRS